MSEFIYNDMSRWDIPKADAVNPGRGPRLPHYATMQAALAHLNPNEAVNVIFPNVLTEQAREFVTNFPGNVLYAVKILFSKHFGGRVLDHMMLHRFAKSRPLHAYYLMPRFI